VVILKLTLPAFKKYYFFEHLFILYYPHKTEVCLFTLCIVKTQITVLGIRLFDQLLLFCLYIFMCSFDRCKHI